MDALEQHRLSMIEAPLSILRCILDARSSHLTEEEKQIRQKKLTDMYHGSEIHPDVARVARIPRDYAN